MLKEFFRAIGTPALYIARPDTEAQTLVYLHPHTTIPRGAKLTVRSDEEAIFFRQGRLAGILTAGPYVLDTANIPFLGGLVDLATGGNHYIAELFFVRTAETRISIGPEEGGKGEKGEELGSFVDLNSRNLLGLRFTAHITLSVTDGVALITRLGGQSSKSGDVARGFVEARLRNCIKNLVAERAQALPIYNVISNALTEELGTAVVARVAPEFAKQGLRLDRFLELSLFLDKASEELLGLYQRREAELVIDAKGAQIAADPGFATYNAVKGNRQVAEGLGTGLGKGMSGPLIGMGFGFGLGPGVPGAGAGSRGPSPSAGAAEAGAVRTSRRPDRYFVQATGITEGPYVARQVALWIMARGGTPETATVRVDGDPENLWCPASSEPSIMMEYSRRMPTRTSQPSGPPSPSSPPAPEPAAKIRFAYWNGEVEERDLTPGEVAGKVRANEGETNMVWAEGFGGWQIAREVPEIAALLARMPPRPPR